jgi:hypothetical protein
MDGESSKCDKCNAKRCAWQFHQCSGIPLEEIKGKAYKPQAMAGAGSADEPQKAVTKVEQCAQRPKECAGKCKTVKFKKGHPGMTFDGICGNVISIDKDGQAFKHGVHPNWWIMKINGKTSYSADALADATSTKHEHYTLSFYPGDDDDDAKDKRRLASDMVTVLGDGSEMDEAAALVI